MRVLWFTGTPSLYEQGNNHYHGCGWIESLELLIRERQGIELGVSFLHDKDSDKKIKNNSTYYPILLKPKKNPFKKLIYNWIGKIEKRNVRKDIEDVITDFQPDIIQVFGTEGVFSQVQNFTNIPVVYHIQGLINPCLNTYFPVKYSTFSFHLNIDYFFKTIKGNSPAFDYKRFYNQALRERKVLMNAKYMMGRTHWDKMVVKLYNKDVQYYHIDEILRPLFYDNESLPFKKNNKFIIVSTLSPTVYKGIDLILKTAKLLKELVDFEFEWNIVGIQESSILFKHFEKIERIKHKEVDIVCKGIMKPEELFIFLKSADVFVHPSYIDNSSNAICEAQMLGLPVIACNVGGVSTLIEHNKTGFLVPSNGVFEIVHYLRLLNDSDTLVKNTGQQSKLIAEKRHNREVIVENLLKTYKQIIG